MTEFKVDIPKDSITIDGDSENDKFWREVKSKDGRVGVAPRAKRYKSEHTIAPAYNKGGYQVIPLKEIKDIGR